MRLPCICLHQAYSLVGETTVGGNVQKATGNIFLKREEAYEQANKWAWCSYGTCSGPAVSVRFSSVAQSCPTLCDPMNHSTPGLPVHHQLPGFTQTHVHLVGDAIQPSHPLSSPSPPAPNPSQRQSLFQWVNSSHEVAKVLEFQLQHESFQWTPRTDLF